MLFEICFSQYQSKFRIKLFYFKKKKKKKFRKPLTYIVRMSSIRLVYYLQKIFFVDNKSLPRLIKHPNFTGACLRRRVFFGNSILSMGFKIWPLKSGMVL